MQTSEQTNKNRSRVVVIATHNVVKLPTKATSSTLCEYTVSIYRRLLYCNAIVCLTLVCASLVQITGVCRTNSVTRFAALHGFNLFTLRDHPKGSFLKISIFFYFLQLLYLNVTLIPINRKAFYVLRKRLA